MFKNFLKRNAESVQDTEAVIIPCACDKDNEHCDLILKLREKQVLRKEIKDKIDALNKDGHELIFNFFCLLKTLESRGFEMNYDRYRLNTNDNRNMHILEYVLDNYSSDDIFRISEELKTYKTKADIISDKQRVLKAVETDIGKIKSKLGIE